MVLTDPSHWYNFYDLCSGNKQSPIDIVPSAAMPQNFQPIYLGNYDTSDKPLSLTNNGHTGKIIFWSRTILSKLYRQEIYIGYQLIV